RDDTPHHRIHDEWLRLVSRLGYTPRRVGAQDAAEVREALRARGLPVEVLTASTWVIHYSPRTVLDSILRREWSLTWHVPDDMFLQSAPPFPPLAAPHYTA